MSYVYHFAVNFSQNSSTLSSSMVDLHLLYRTKLKLFTSFDEKVDAHNSVLLDRAKILEGVKAKLVAQSGSILA